MVTRYSSLVIFVAIFNISCTAPNKALERAAGNPMVRDNTLVDELAVERQRLADEKIQRLKQQSLSK